MSTETATVLDRTQVSDRKAVHISMVAAKSLGCESNDIAIYCSTIRKGRISIGRQISVSSGHFQNRIRITISNPSFYCENH